MIGVMLMVYSISDKKSPRRGRRAEHQSTDSRRRTRRKNPSQGLGRLHLSSCYFSQAFEDRHFTKREIPFAGRILRSDQPRGWANVAIDAIPKITGKITRQ